MVNGELGRCLFSTSYPGVRTDGHSTRLQVELLSGANSSSPARDEDRSLHLSLLFHHTLLTTPLFCSTTTLEGERLFDGFDEASFRTDNDALSFISLCHFASSASASQEPSTPSTTFKFTSHRERSSSQTPCELVFLFSSLSLSFLDHRSVPSLPSLRSGTATFKISGLTLLFPSRFTPSTQILALFEPVSRVSSSALDRARLNSPLCFPFGSFSQSPTTLGTSTESPSLLTTRRSTCEQQI